MMQRHRRACAVALKLCRLCCRQSPRADKRANSGMNSSQIEQRSMRFSQRLIAVTIAIALSGLVAGCSSMGSMNLDPTDLLDFLDTKKKLSGDRKPVFPEGVPGVEQGVPKDLYKGAAVQEQIPQME